MSRYTHPLAVLAIASAMRRPVLLASVVIAVLRVDEAAIVVLRQIAGDPPDVIKSLTDTLRNLSKEH